MSKKFLTNLGFLVFLNMLIKPFWILGIDRTVQNVVGPEEYGTYFALFNFSFLFQIILDFGINNFNNRNIAQQPERMAVYFSTTLIAKIAFSIIYTIVVFIIAFGIQFSARQISILSLLILFQVLVSFYTFMRSNIAAMHLFKTDSVLSVLDKFISSIACGILLWKTIPGFHFTIDTFLWVQILSYIISILVAFVIILNHSIKIKWVFTKSLLKEIILKSYPFAMLGFLMTVYYRIDGVMIERMLGSSGALEAGIYASAFRLLDAANILGFMFAGILLPMFSRMLEKKEPILNLLTLSFKLMLVVSCACGITCIFYRNTIMQILYTDATDYYGSIFGWLMVSFVNVSIVYIYGTLLTANGNLRNLNRIAFAGVCINILLNVLLIPDYHALGSAIATVLTQLIVTTAHVAVANKQFTIQRPYTVWFRPIIFISMVVAINYIFSFLNIYWVINICMCFALSLAASFISGLFKVQDVRAFIMELRTD